jgi:hypothetical protein
MTAVVAGKSLTPRASPPGADAAQVAAVPASLPLSPAAVAVPVMAALPVAAALPVTAAPPPTEAPPDQTQAATEPPVESGQIWQCTTNGVKTFSNNPCGENSTLLEMRAINTMNPAPQVHYARAPDPRYAPQYANPNAYGDPNAYGQDDSDQGNGDYPGSYGVVPGYAFLPRRRSEPPHRPESHHNSGPVRRN